MSSKTHVHRVKKLDAEIRKRIAELKTSLSSDLKPMRDSLIRASRITAEDLAIRVIGPNEQR